MSDCPEDKHVHRNFLIEKFNEHQCALVVLRWISFGMELLDYSPTSVCLLASLLRCQSFYTYRYVCVPTISAIPCMLCVCVHQCIDLHTTFFRCNFCTKTMSFEFSPSQNVYIYTFSIRFLWLSNKISLRFELI